MRLQCSVYCRIVSTERFQMSNAALLFHTCVSCGRPPVLGNAILVSSFAFVGLLNSSSTPSFPFSASYIDLSHVNLTSDKMLSVMVDDFVPQTLLYGLW